MTIKIFNEDCLEWMKRIPDWSIDAIITDTPYGTVSNICSSEWFNHWMKWKTWWDTALPIKDIFENAERVLRMNWCLILFSQEPYTSQLITQAHWNLPFSYRMVWKKDHFANALIAKVAPVSYYEDILVFFKTYDTTNWHPLRTFMKWLIDFIGKSKKTLFEEMWHQWICHFWRYNSTQFDLCTEKTYNELIDRYSINKMEWFKKYYELKEIHKWYWWRNKFNLWEWKKYKSNVLEYKKDYEWLHPTQKPFLLLEDLVKTYTNEWETVLDFTMWSGTTWVACKNTNRNFIWFEMDKVYYEIAKERINNHIPW